MHSKDAAKASAEGNHPQLAPEMRQCATIKTKVNGCKAYIILDTGSTRNFMSPAFAKVTGMNILATAHITIRLHRQPIQNHTWW